MALIEAPFDGFFLRVVRAMQPYHGKVVFIGGCANALYRHHPLASSMAANPLTTLDLDLATPSRLSIINATPLHAALERAGLHPLPANRRTNKFSMSPTANETLKLLCPTTGITKAIRNRSPALVNVQPDCMAEALDYLDLLLLSPWTSDLKDVPPLAVTESLPITIPNPVSYAMQKVLIRSRRGSPAKRAKDCYYIYEIAVLFRNVMPLFTETAGQLAQHIPSKWCKDFVRLASQTFGHGNAEGIQDVLTVAEGNSIPVTADMIQPAVGNLVTAMSQGFSSPKGYK